MSYLKRKSLVAFYLMTITLIFAFNFSSVVYAADGYVEVHRRFDVSYKSAEKELNEVASIEAKWIKYIMEHVVGNYANLDGYTEFRRRLDIKYEVAEKELNIEAVRANSIEAKWIKYIMEHVVGNYATPSGYAEFRRRLDVKYKEAKKELDETVSIEAKWVKYMMEHIVGNTAYMPL